MTILHQSPNTQMTSAFTLRGIRACVRDLLSKCSIPYTVTSFDPSFVDACLRDARKRGCPLSAADGDLRNTSCASSPWQSGQTMVFDAQKALPSIQPKIIEGACIAATAYRHHDENLKVYIALYTAVLIYIEDYMQDADNVAIVAEFTTRFVKAQPQVHPVLGALADLLREAHDLFAPVAANMIVTSGLSFVTANWLEHSMGGLQMTPSSMSIPEYARRLSGSAEAYAVFVFGVDTPPDDYVQALPDMVTVINYINDILSFYKEEIGQETANFISIAARCQNASKLDVLRQLTAETIACHERIDNILEGDSHARTMYNCFCEGYVSFHASASRYRLSEVV